MTVTDAIFLVAIALALVAPFFLVFLGAILPTDYKILLEMFGEFHLPGKAVVCLSSPTAAAKKTESYLGLKSPFAALAISDYHKTSDGNCMGFLRDGARFGDELFEFDHELRSLGDDDPRKWTRKNANSLAAFIVKYLKRR